MRTLIVFLALLLSSPAHAIILVGFGGSTCATQSQDVLQDSVDATSTWASQDTRGQSFKAGVTGSLYSFSFYVSTYSNNGSDPFVLRIGTTADLTSSYLAEANKTCTGTGWLTFVFPEGSRPSLTAGTTYYVFAQRVSAASTIAIDRDGTSPPYADGNAYLTITKVWNPSTATSDLRFKTTMCD